MEAKTVIGKWLKQYSFGVSRDAILDNLYKYEMQQYLRAHMLTKKVLLGLIKTHGLANDKIDFFLMVYGNFLAEEIDRKGVEDLLLAYKIGGKRILTNAS